MLNVVTYNLTNTIGVNMKPLEKKLILGADGKTMVYVYDGDVDYRPTKDSINYKYYWNEDGKRCKTRPYIQYSSMTNRCKKDGKHKVVYPEYIDAHINDDFNTFDKWCEWAETKIGYMCLDDSGNLYQQDKDLLGDSSGLYGKLTCCFVEPKLNSLIKLLDSDVKGVRVTGAGGYQVVIDGKVINVSSREEAVYLAYQRDKSKLKQYIDDNFETLDEGVINVLLERLDGLNTRDVALHEDMLRKKKESEIISKLKMDLSSITDEKKSKGGNYPKNISKKGKRFQVQMTFRGKTFVENGKARKLFDKLRDAEVYQAQKQLDLFEILEMEYLINDFIPKNLVDKFYSSKNFYINKLEMLLSCAF